MARTVWKAVLKSPINHITVPAGAEMLCAREQAGEVCIWFLCDPDAAKETRTVAVVGTGYPAPEDGRYLGTAMLDGGSLVFHVFERIG